MASGLGRYLGPAGYPRFEYSVLLLGEQGLDISGHRSMPVDEQSLADADLILCMETGHAEALKAEFAEQADRVYLLSEMAGLRYSINDPYGGPRSEYQRMIDEVTSLIDDGLPRIVELGRENARARQGQG
jgi:protein-tyrosine-phosphatase